MRDELLQQAGIGLEPSIVQHGAAFGYDACDNALASPTLPQDATIWYAIRPALLQNRPEHVQTEAELFLWIEGAVRGALIRLAAQQ